MALSKSHRVVPTDAHCDSVVSCSERGEFRNPEHKKPKRYTPDYPDYAPSYCIANQESQSEKTNRIRPLSLARSDFERADTHAGGSGRSPDESSQYFFCDHQWNTTTTDQNVYVTYDNTDAASATVYGTTMTRSRSGSLTNSLVPDWPNLTASQRDREEVALEHNSEYETRHHQQHQCTSGADEDADEPQEVTNDHEVQYFESSDELKRARLFQERHFSEV
jgi:hypothetical protein